MKRVKKIFIESRRIRKQKKLLRKYIDGGFFIIHNSICRKAKFSDFINLKFLFFGFCKISKTKQINEIIIKKGETKIVYIVNKYAICFYQFKDRYYKMIEKLNLINQLPFNCTKIVEKNNKYLCIICEKSEGCQPNNYDGVIQICSYYLQNILNLDKFSLQNNLMLCHGDFGSSNVFLKSNTFECIDLDNIGYYPYLNDIFHLILLPMIYHDDEKFLNILNDKIILNLFISIEKKFQIGLSFRKTFEEYFRYWNLNEKMGYSLFGEKYSSFFNDKNNKNKVLQFICD